MTALTYVLYGLFVLSCFILILVVLLQPGKGDAATALGGGVTGAAFGPRGATTLLAKITIGAAVSFMAIGFLLSVPGLITDRSVTSGMEVPAAAPETSLPTDTPAPAGAPGGAVPAGQMTIDEKGNITGGALPTAPAGAEQQPATAPADQKPAETKPAATKPAETKPADKSKKPGKTP